MRYLNPVRWLIAAVVALVPLALPSGPASALEDGTPLPAAGGIVDVRRFGAKGDGATDDTEAIQKAIDSVPVAPGRIFWETPIVYFPAGIYVISGTLDRRDRHGLFTSGLVLVGEGRDKSVIRLADRAPGFDDPSRPKAMVMTSARLLDGDATSGGKDYTNRGEGNDAYANYVEDLTLDVGSGNPGAIALDYLANNIGAVRRVRLVGREGSGLTGLSLTRKWIGPALVEDLEVEGFPRGIEVASTEYGVTMAHVRIEGSTEVGLRNSGNLVAVDDLAIESTSGPAIENTDFGGLIVAAGVRLNGDGDRAIANAGYLTLSGVATTGYRALMPGVGLETTNGRFAPDDHPLGPAEWVLPASDPPAVEAGPPEEWANVVLYGAVPDRNVDSTAAMRRAFASGASTILLPYGTYMVTDGIEIPPTVRRILGMHAAITVGDHRIPTFDRRANGIFRVLAPGEPLKIEKLTFDMTDRGGQLAFEHSADRTLILQDIVTAGLNVIVRSKDGGPLYVSNACCGNVSVAGPAPVWMRQFNSEGARSPRITNDGAPVRVLGMKVEQEVTAVRNAGGGTTELLGGFFYPVVPGQPADPLAINEGGRVSLAYVEEAFWPDAVYDLHLASPHGNGEVHAWTLPMRNAVGARIVPQLTDQRE